MNSRNALLGITVLILLMFVIVTSSSSFSPNGGGSPTTLQTTNKKRSSNEISFDGEVASQHSRRNNNTSSSTTPPPPTSAPPFYAPFSSSDANTLDSAKFGKLWKGSTCAKDYSLLGSSSSSSSTSTSTVENILRAMYFWVFNNNNGADSQENARRCLSFETGVFSSVTAGAAHKPQQKTAALKKEAQASARTAKLPKDVELYRNKSKWQQPSSMAALDRASEFLYSDGDGVVWDLPAAAMTHHRQKRRDAVTGSSSLPSSSSSAVAAPASAAAAAAAAGTPQSYDDEFLKQKNVKTDTQHFSACQTGSCLATAISTRLREITTISDNDIPPWMLIVGDSRMRQLFRRLVSMIRSNLNIFAYPRQGEEERRHQRNEEEDGRNRDDDELADSEMHRTGILEERFHRNASYVVYGVRETVLYTPVSDVFKIHEPGEGCSSFFSSSRGKNHNNNSKKTSRFNQQHQQQVGGGGGGGPPGTVVMFRFCFQWHTEISQHEVTGALDDLYNNVVSIAWMPTLWGCTLCDRDKEKKQSTAVAPTVPTTPPTPVPFAEDADQQQQQQPQRDNKNEEITSDDHTEEDENNNEQRRADQPPPPPPKNQNQQAEDPLYPCCPQRSRKLVEVAKDAASIASSSADIANTPVQNFLLMTVPQSTRPDLMKSFPAYGIFQQNHASVYGFDVTAVERHDKAERVARERAGLRGDEQPIVRPRPQQIGKYFHDKGLFTYAIRSVASKSSSSSDKQTHDGEQRRSKKRTSHYHAPIMQQWVLDYSSWSGDLLKPVMCDRIHLQCQIRRNKIDSEVDKLHARENLAPVSDRTTKAAVSEIRGNNSTVSVTASDAAAAAAAMTNDNTRKSPTGSEPEEDTYVSGQCNMCRDEVGFVVVLEMLKILLA